MSTLFEMLTDFLFMVSADAQAKAHAEDADTYFYVYAHTTEEKAFPDLEWLGECI